MRITGSQIEFWNDQPQGSGVGVAAPARWRIQYWDLGAGQWADVPNPSGALRVPAGTVILVEMSARQPAAAARVGALQCGALAR